MHKMKFLTSLFLCLMMLFYTNSFAVYAFVGGTSGGGSTNEPESAMEEVLMTSPDNYALENSNALFTGLINTYSPQGKQFAKQHAEIAYSTIRDIQQFNYQVNRNKVINKQYYDNIVNQLNFWREQTKKYSFLKTVYNMEIEVFNMAFQLQNEEVLLTAEAQGIKDELDRLEQEDSTPANESFIKSTLYKQLLLININLVEFYKKKYKTLLAYAALQHALQENPSFRVPPDVLEKVKVYHEKEMDLTKLLLTDFEYLMENLQQLDKQSQSLLALFNEMDVYSLSELRKLREQLESDNGSNKFAGIDISDTVKGYIELYKGLEESLEEKIKDYEERKLSYYQYKPNMNDNKLVYLPSDTASCVVYSWTFKGLASDTYNVLSTGVKTVAGAPFAVADYATGKIAEGYYTTVDVGSKLVDTIKNNPSIDGIKEFATYTKDYIDLGDKIHTVSIKDTFIKPMINTLKGDHKNGLGQSAVNKAQGSFKANDEYFKNLVGNEYVSDIALNVVTLGGYGFAKDVTTINDAKASVGDKAAATVGIALSLIPAVSGSGAVKGGGKQVVNSVGKGTTKVTNAIIKSETKKVAADTAKSQLNKAYKNLVKKAGSYIDDLPSGYTQSAAFIKKMIAEEGDQTVKAALVQYRKSLVKNTLAQNALKNAEKQIAKTATNQVKKGLKDTLKETIKGGLENLGGKEQLKNALKDHYKDTLKDAITKSGGVTKFVMDQSIDNLTNKVITDTTKSGTNYVAGNDDSAKKSTKKNKNKKDPNVKNPDPDKFIVDSDPNNQQNPDPNVKNPDPNKFIVDSNPNNQKNPDPNVKSPDPNNPPVYGPQLPPGYDPNNTTNNNPPVYGPQLPPGYDPNNTTNNNPPMYGPQLPPGYDPNNTTNNNPPVYGPQLPPGYDPNNTANNNPPVYGPQLPPGYYNPNNPGNNPPIYGPNYNPYGPPQYTDPNLLNQYLGGNQNNPNGNNHNKPNAGDIDNVLSMVQGNQNNFNNNRTNYDPNQPYIAQNPNLNNTDPTAGHSGQNTTQRIQGIQNQTQQWQNQNNVPQYPPKTPNPPSPQNPTTPPNQNTNTLGNIPVGDGVPEKDTTNGIDDDNDGVIDEGGNGNMEIAIHDTGGDKDDQWEVYLDGKSLGRNNKGKTRFWTRTVTPGQHSVSAVGVQVPDNTGTYTIGFKGCSVVSGPARTGRDLNNGVKKTWVINCQ